MWDICSSIMLLFTFKQHTEKTSNVIKFNLATFYHLTSLLNLQVAKIDMLALIFSSIVLQLGHM